MQRRSLLLFTSLLPLGLVVPRYLRAWASPSLVPIDYRGQAEKLNQLASDIHTPTDARQLVDFVAGMFSKQLPPASMTSTMFARIAQAEFSSASDSQKQIPESRLAEAWNTYVQTIQAPDEMCKVTVAEVHNLRDAFFVTARTGWNRGMRNIWTVPAIYATQADGTIAPGCRAIESIRVLWDLANMPDNFKSARIRASKGVLVSNLMREEPPPSGNRRSYVVAGLRREIRLRSPNKST